MPAPRNYVRGYSFAGYQATNPNRPLPGPALDNELEEIEQSLTEAISGLNDIRRADGQLKNGIVGVDALAPDIITGVRPATLWQAGIQYQAQDTVSYLAAFYRCTINHLSTDFLTDLTATRWELYADIGGTATDAQIARNEAVAARNEAVPAGAAATAGSNNVTALYDLFDDRYLGEKTVLPLVDNDGNAIVDGALVSLTGQTPTTLNGMYVRRGGLWHYVVAPFLGAFAAYRYVATAAQTVITGADANGGTLAYTPGAIMVTVNGVTLEPNTYTATNGTSVVLGTALSASDAVVIYSFGSFSVADAESANFTPAGAGAVVRTIQSKLRDVVSVMDFGADPTGVASSSSAVTSAIAAKSLVYFDAGTYNIATAVTPLATTVIVLEPGVILTGANASSVLDPAAGKIINLGRDQVGYAPPLGEGTDQSLYLKFNGNFDNIQIDKWVRGVTTSNGSDGRFPAFQVQQYNDLRRDAVNKWWNVNGGAFYSRIYCGLTQPFRGGAVGSWNEVYVYDQADHATRNTGGEPCGVHVTNKAHWGVGRQNGSVNYWGLDVNVGGPSYADTLDREGLLIAGSFTSNKLTVGTGINFANSDAQKRGSYVIAAQSAPGIGLLPYLGDDTWAGKTTHPLRAAMVINGYSGAYDGANAATDGHDADAGLMAEIGLRIGNWGGAWPDIRANPQVTWNSKIGNGLWISDYVFSGLVMEARHPSGVAVSLDVRRGAGPLAIAEEFRQTSIRAYDNAAWTNFVSFFGATDATGFVTMRSEGSAANLGFSIEPKGNGWLTLSGGGSLRVAVNSTGLGFFGATPLAQQTITGSRGGNVALANLLTALASHGLIIDSTT
jgi:hypothetical protein